MKLFHTALRLTAGAAALAAISAILGVPSGPGARSQGRTIRIVVPYPAGSGPDILSRIIGDELSRTNGPNLVVENRAGGATLIGTEAVMRAPPDGNTILLVANTFVIN